MNIFFIGNS
jgi:hypothetical protein